MTEDRDDALVKRVLSGDREAYRGIVDRHRARIYYLGLKFFHSPENAEDFAQEVFLRSYEKLSTFRGRSPFSAWLYRLAYNLAVNHYHLARRRLAATVPEEIEDTSETPEARFVKKEERQRIIGMMRDLPDVYNVVLKMHYYDGLTYEEISRSMGIPINTVKSHVHRAKKILARKMVSHG